MLTFFKPFNSIIDKKGNLKTANLFLFHKIYEALEVRDNIAFGDSSPFSILASNEIKKAPGD